MPVVLEPSRNLGIPRRYFKKPKVLFRGYHIPLSAKYQVGHTQRLDSDSQCTVFQISSM